MRVYEVEREIGLLRAKKRHYESMGFSISPKLTGMPGSGQRGASKVETSAVNMVDILSELDQKIAEYAKIISDAEKLIARIPQEKYRQLLTLRYLARMSWRSVSDELGYKDRNSVYRAHGYALLEARRARDGKKNRLRGAVTKDFTADSRSSERGRDTNTSSGLSGHSIRAGSAQGDR